MVIVARKHNLRCNYENVAIRNSHSVKKSGDEHPLPFNIEKGIKKNPL